MKRIFCDGCDAEIHNGYTAISGRGAKTLGLANGLVVSAEIRSPESREDVCKDCIAGALRQVATAIKGAST